MNNHIKNTFRAGVLALASFFAFASCSDTWDDHFESAASLSYEGSTMDYIKTASNLSDFAEVLEATGYDRELKSAQVLTVLAPRNGSFNKDSLLAVVEAGNKNDVINRFIKNHLLRYNVSLGIEEQKYTLLNTKTVRMGTKEQPTVQGITVLDPNVSCSNGVIQVLDDDIPYVTNIYELLSDDLAKYKETNGITEPDTSVISLFSFFKRYDNDLLDTDRSVVKGNDDMGNIVYIDSVTIRNNDLATRMNAYIFREDSNYVAIAPTVEAYQKRYNEVKEYFKFNPGQVNASSASTRESDSLQYYYANYYTTSDLFYNMNTNQYPKDSLFSTIYSRYDWRHSVFYTDNKWLTPDREADLKDAGRVFYGDIFANLGDSVTCSNGKVYRVDEIPYTVYDNFFKTIKIEGENLRNYLEDSEDWTTKDDKDLGITFTSKTHLSDTIDISKDSYVYIEPTKNADVKYSFDIPSTLSGTYDVYICMVPMQVFLDDENDTINKPVPSKFRVKIYQRETTSTAPFSTTKNRETFYSDEARTKEDFVYADTMGVCPIKLGTITLNNCYLTQASGVRLQISTNVTTGEARRGLYTRAMCIDYILFEPHKDIAKEEEETPVRN